MHTKFWGPALVVALTLTLSAQQEKRTLPR